MKQPITLSYGGGVNSTAMLVGIVESHPELRPDLVMFADTAAEKPETYAFVARVAEWMQSNGLPEITVVRESRITLEQECIDKQTLPSIVTGIRSCSDHFKIRPQNRYVRQWEPAIRAWERKSRVLKLVGFDADEPHRVKDYSGTLYEVRFPLIEWQWGREECIAAIERAGLPRPPKSSCFFCPEMREWEIVDLNATHPELAERALRMERNNTALTQVNGLARRYSWQQILDFHKDQQTLPILPSRIPCVCFDGDGYE